MLVQWARESQKAFAQVDGYEVALCDIKQEWAEGGKRQDCKRICKTCSKRENDTGEG